MVPFVALQAQGAKKSEVGLLIMKFVYLIQSISYHQQRYIGLTSNLDQRLKEHNAGRSPHTSKHAPWKLVVAVRFEDDESAAKFEKYLKSGSGHAFANKHLW
jgi:putative endonuclease